MNRMVIGTLLLAGAAPAFAQDTFIVTRGDQLYRYDGSTTNFTLSDSLHSLSNTDRGIFGVSNTQENPGDPPFDYEGWTLTNPYGTPGLNRVATFTAQRFPTITQVGNTLYGIGGDQLYTIAGDYTTTFVANIDPSAGIGGSGYDAASDTFYVTNSTTNALHTLNLNDGTMSQIGLGVGFEFRNQGGEWWNGQYWAAFEDLTNDRLVLGTIDTTTGLFDLEAVLLQGLGNLEFQTMGLAIIPAPGTLALLGLSGLAVSRRRR